MRFFDRTRLCLAWLFRRAILVGALFGLSNTPSYGLDVCGTIVTEPPITTAIEPTGAYKALIIFAKFPDGWDPEASCQPDPYDDELTEIPTWATNLLEDITSPQAPAVEGSLTHYFWLMSGGQHYLVGAELGPIITLEKGISHYIQPQNGGMSQATYDVIATVDQEQDPTADFSQYDIHGPAGPDGVVDFVFIYFRSKRTALGQFLVTYGGTASLGTWGDYVTDDDGVIVRASEGAILTPATADRRFWNLHEVASHEYGHHVLNNIDNGWLGHMPSEGRFGLMHGNSGVHGGPPLMSTWMRWKLGWISPKQTITLSNPGDETTVTLKDIGAFGDDGFVLVNTQSSWQKFILECRDSTETIYTRGSGEGGCAFVPGPSGLLITHVSEKKHIVNSQVGAERYVRGWWESNGGVDPPDPWDCPLPDCEPQFGECIDEKYPPAIGYECAGGSFNRTTWVPDPISGRNRISVIEELLGDSQDLFGPGPPVGSGPWRSNLFTPYTNPNTNLYFYPPSGSIDDDQYCSQRQDQTVYSGLSFYNTNGLHHPGLGRVKCV